MRPAKARVLPVAALALVLAGCGTTTAGSPAAVTTTATSTATVTATATATPSTAPADHELATRLAALACERYVFAGTQDAASGSASYDTAAGTGTSAAVVDPAWTDLAGALAFLAALPETDNTAADIARATTERAVVRTRCGDAGVTVRD